MRTTTEVLSLGESLAEACKLLINWNRYQDVSRQEITATLERVMWPWVRWPRTACLLWNGCVRMQLPYVYPQALISKLQRSGVHPDTRRSNGPGLTAFEAANGSRPKGWVGHHIYDGSYISGLVQAVGAPCHGVANPRHFTQSAGMAGLHPDAHRVAHGDMSIPVENSPFCRSKSAPPAGH
jgi:hypothetical protein